MFVGQRVRVSDAVIARLAAQGWPTERVTSDRGTVVEICPDGRVMVEWSQDGTWTKSRPEELVAE